MFHAVLHPLEVAAGLLVQGDGLLEGVLVVVVLLGSGGLPDLLAADHLKSGTTVIIETFFAAAVAGCFGRIAY